MKNSNIKNITTEINDINHISTTLWFSGCKINCEGCHNTNLEFFNSGLNMEEIKNQLIERRKITNWLVYLGGNPLDSIESVLEISSFAKSLNFKQFIYSGYSFSEFQEMFDAEIHKTLLKNFDYIKTGKFDLKFHKDCASFGKEYFFATLNQEIYKNQEKEWRKFYSFDLYENKIFGTFALN